MSLTVTLLVGSVEIVCGQTDHKPVEPSVGYRFEYEGAVVVTAGDTVPCAGLDALCQGAHGLVHTVIRKDLIEKFPIQRMQDTLDYHSSPAEAGQTAARADVDTLILTHYVPALGMGGTVDDWRDLAATTFGRRIELGDDLHRVVIKPRPVHQPLDDIHEISPHTRGTIRRPGRLSVRAELCRHL